MCGRFTNRYTWRELCELYGISDTLYPPSNFEPQYNIAPTQNCFVVRRATAGRELALLRWGLLPGWSKSPADGVRMINARCETVASSPAYRAPFRERPCLVVADGFYEWKVVGPKEKQPYFITRKEGAPFAFAGLWEPKSIADRDTFTIITCPANAACAPIHDRMPVMLAPEDWDVWLGAPDQRKDLLRPFPAEQMALRPVDKAVGSPKNTGPELIEPASA